MEIHKLNCVTMDCQGCNPEYVAALKETHSRECQDHIKTIGQLTAVKEENARLRALIDRCNMYIRTGLDGESVLNELEAHYKGCK